ncbi:MAG: M23 family metallopeptidase [Porphyromonadaceae bacterium]|nr:M23 family metallopeptidase [Porphyromonadaceae bacterium]
MWKKLRFSYKLTIFNEQTLDMIFTFRISRLRIIFSILIVMILIGLATGYLMIYTPLRGTLPGYVTQEIRRQIVENALSVDSLSRIVTIQKNYFDNMAVILGGKIQLDTTKVNDNDQLLHTISTDSLLPASNATNSFLRQYAEESKYTLDIFSTNEADNLVFYPPVKGQVTHSFNPQRQIFGVRITPTRQEPVAATLDGTVIAAYSSDEKGYVIEIQHNNNFMSIYLYNEKLLKSVGEKVLAGENIAISGSLTEGKMRPYVEFQLWHQGIPLDPSGYIHF